MWTTWKVVDLMSHYSLKYILSAAKKLCSKILLFFSIRGQSFAQVFQHSEYGILGSLQLIALLGLYTYVQKTKIWSIFNILKLQKKKFPSLLLIYS